jgi:hypothetical protein
MGDGNDHTRTVIKSQSTRALEPVPAKTFFREPWIDQLRIFMLRRNHGKGLLGRSGKSSGKVIV